jgi:hypothetical protein
MALSNKLGWLVLATGNKSEMSVGYATLYGDMAGGFALLKDVFKTDVWPLARRLNERAGRELIPASIIERAPSAELAPGQRDEDSLPPYDELDPVLEEYVERDRSREELLDAGFDPTVVSRVLALVDRAEYKRRQAPPGVKLPKAWAHRRRLERLRRAGSGRPATLSVGAQLPRRAYGVRRRVDGLVVDPHQRSSGASLQGADRPSSPESSPASTSEIGASEQIGFARGGWSTRGCCARIVDDAMPDEGVSRVQMQAELDIVQPHLARSSQQSPGQHFPRPTPPGTVEPVAGDGAVERTRSWRRNTTTARPAAGNQQLSAPRTSAATLMQDSGVRG